MIVHNTEVKLLYCLYIPAFPGQDTLNFTKVKKAEIHGSGFTLKLLDGENWLMPAHDTQHDDQIQSSRKLFSWCWNPLRSQRKRRPAWVVAASGKRKD